MLIVIHYKIYINMKIFVKEMVDSDCPVLEVNNQYE
jgi:hypothetical protein